MSSAPRVALCFVVLAAAATYPLIDVLDPALPDHDDAQFNVWRLSWVAHQLPADPWRLFDANIFHPSTRTLALSDAMLAVGLAGTPFIRLGVHPVAVHNLLVIAALAASGLAMWALCRELTGSGGAGLVGGAIFSLAPYRVGHIAHLELQWAAFMPLTLLVLHRAAARPDGSPWRHGLAAGALLALQGYASLYYVAFFGIALAVWSALTLASAARSRARLLRTLAVAAVTAALLLAPYLAVYLTTRAALGGRSTAEIGQFSATPADYARVSSQNRLYGPAASTSHDERTLFPGLAPLALALAALVLARGRLRWIYLGITAAAVDLSLGVNGVSYPLLLRLAEPISSFRAPARFGIVVLLGLGVLAALGAAAIATRAGGRARLVAPALLLVIAFEYWSAPIDTRAVPLAPSNVYRWLAAQPPAVVLEVPAPGPSTLWGSETLHQFNTIYHWQRLVNGYSGFAPPSYLETLHALESRDAARISARLQQLGVDYVVIHQSLLGPSRFAEELTFFSNLPGAGSPQSFVDPDDPAVVVPLGR